MLMITGGNRRFVTVPPPIAEAVDSGDGGVFFLEGCGGSGQIFAENAALAKVRPTGKIPTFGTIFGFSD